MLLLALWLPVTQHCNLVATGLLTDHSTHYCTGDCTPTPATDSCGADHCQSVEDSTYRPSVDTLKVDAPVFALLTCWCCLHAISPATIAIPLLTPAGTSPPPELAPSWLFMTRAAPSPRAPSVLV
jgi:hypothetical protein